MSRTTISRRAFGKFLREIRGRAGRTALAAGVHIEVSRQTLLRLEEGFSTKIATAQLEQLLDFYDADPEVRVEARAMWNDVKEQAKVASLQGSSKGIWQPYVDQLFSHFPHYLRLESACRQVTTHQAVLVPGLLQTSEYRRAIAKIEDPDLSAVNIERRLELAVRRRERLEDPGFRFDAILSEAVIRYQLGGPIVMAGQLRWLNEVSERENVNVRVIPFDKGSHRGLLIQSFSLLDFPRLGGGFTEPPVVYVEGVIGALYHEQSDVIARYRAAIRDLKAVALNEDETRTLVSRVAKEYES
ncbi:helix-turn-helix domain-containing protein [Nocardia sp. NPDC055321]